MSTGIRGVERVKKTLKVANMSNHIFFLLKLYAIVNEFVTLSYKRVGVLMETNLNVTLFTVF